MIACESLVERMPLVARGSEGWTAEEAAHLAACPDCSGAWRVVQAAARLGQAQARRVNSARVSGAVLSRLAAERRRRRLLRGGGLVGLAAAAALVLMVSGRRVAEPNPEVAVAGQELYVPLAELESLDEGQLEDVLDGLEAPLSDGGPVAPPSLGDLDDGELERVLRSLEG